MTPENLIPRPDALRGKRLLTGEQIEAFLGADIIHVFDPDTKAPVATVRYSPDGVVKMTLGDMTDTGGWGIVGDRYWTQYAIFRDSQRHEFYLEVIDAETMQAHFADGRRAFLQSRLSSLEDAT
jgi:hypothetical protein